MKDRWVIPVRYAFVFQGICVLVAIVYFVGAARTPYIPKHDSPIDLRGNSLLTIRLPTTPLEEITVYEDGYGIRASFPLAIQARYLLNTTEINALRDLQADWCHAQPAGRSLNTPEPFYNVAIRCGDGVTMRIEQRHILPSDLPPILAVLIQRIK